MRATTGSNQDIWILDLVHKNGRRLTFGEFSDSFPIWTQDGKRIAFASNLDAKASIYWKSADGTGVDELLAAESGVSALPCSWSDDGKTLIVMDFGNTTLNAGIAAISMEGDHAIKPLLDEKNMEVEPKISPDGQWMAYSSDESGQFQIFVRPYPEVDGGKWQISTSGGVWPLWSPDGRELFYRSGNEFMAVAVKTEPTFSFGAPRILFQGTYVVPTSSFLSNWDIHPDGKRFLLIKPVNAAGSESTSAGPRKINIVLNWFEELKEKAPVE